MDLIYESTETQVLRVPGGDGGPALIRKRVLGPSAPRRVRHEIGILGRLAGIDGMPRLAVDECEPDAIVLIDDGGTTVACLAASLRDDLSAVVEFAIRVSDIIAEMHRRGVVHRDINPNNIIAQAHGRDPVLIDFDLAATFAEECSDITRQRELAGTLAYLAPEQSGRTGYVIDHRADLYAWGATFFELLTGRPPFVEEDVLALVGHHLTSAPPCPSGLNPAVPPALSEIVLRLLAKAPDDRYQSAEGLRADLRTLQERLAAGLTDPFDLGEFDFPPRLVPPSRLVGRDAELDTLRQALADAVEGRSRGVLVAGGPGVGKTALLDQLRPVVTSAGGWFVAGKFDQYRRDTSGDGVHQVLTGIARLLLAQPSDLLAETRERLLAELGPNVELVRVIPEMAMLLGLDMNGHAGDGQLLAGMENPRLAEARAQRAVVATLAAVASPAHPLVIFLDDLQWAGPTPLGVLDTILLEPGLAGVLVVGAYRPDEVDPAHPLTGMVDRWSRLGAAPEVVTLVDLPPAGVGGLLAQMLRLESTEAGQLAEAIVARTGGNPYDTIAFVNALRTDGVLTLGPQGWCWDSGEISRYVGSADVLELLQNRIAVLPESCAALLATVACLGGQVPLFQLALAAAGDPAGVEEDLRPAMEDGLLVMVRDAGGDVVRFRHDRVQQAAYAGIDVDRQRVLHLTIARRLSGRAELVGVAAQQYLCVVDAIDDPVECHRVATMFHEAAMGLRLTNTATAERLLAAGIGLLGRTEEPDTADLMAALVTERHRVLYGMGRLDEADVVYAEIRRRHTDPVDLLAPTTLQVASLDNRQRHAEAVALGVELLERIGITTGGCGETELAAQREAVCLWGAGLDLDHDLGRGTAGDARVHRTAALIGHTLSPAYLAGGGPQVWPGLMLAAQRLWDTEGPCPALMPCLGILPMIIMGVGGDRRLAYSVGRHLCTVGDARGFEPMVSWTRTLFAAAVQPWFEPVRSCIEHLERSRERLLQCGEIQPVGNTYLAASGYALQSGVTLDAIAEIVEAGMAFAARTGNDMVANSAVSYRQLVRALRGETLPGTFDDDEFSEAAYLVECCADPISSAGHHCHRAIGAAILGQPEPLREHTAALMELLAWLPDLNFVAPGRMMRVLALVDRMGHVTGGERAELAVELDVIRAWMAERAVDMPTSYGHLLRWIDAERAAALGEPFAAVTAFDAALSQAGVRDFPWQQALITERAGLTYLAIGLERVGRLLLTAAYGHYQDWGATAKTTQMLTTHPFLRETRAGSDLLRGKGRSTAPKGSQTIRLEPDSGLSVSFSADTLDLTAILDAARAISSETNLAQLRTRVTEVLGAITGATTVHVLLPDPTGEGWLLPAGDGHDGSTAAPEADRATTDLGEAVRRSLVPLSALRYAERTREPLLVPDATRDGRFAADPYLTGLDHCSLLVVPIYAQGMPRAILVLENRLAANAFTTDRLHAVVLIAGQLAVSLDNALLLTSLERKVTERTAALNAANVQLAQLSITDALTGLANRRRFTQVLDEEWSQARASGESLGAIMIDIDHFKLFNDHYGHLGGDTCLKRVADVIRRHVRSNDLAARYGGEEFVVVLPGATLHATQQIAERIRAAVVALDEPHHRSPFGLVTISVGVASTVPDETSPEQLVAAADAALYRAKNSGRNQVVSGGSGQAA